MLLKQNKTKQNKTKQNKTKQNKTKQNKTKQNKTKESYSLLSTAGMMGPAVASGSLFALLQSAGVIGLGIGMFPHYLSSPYSRQPFPPPSPPSLSPSLVSPFQPTFNIEIQLLLVVLLSRGLQWVESVLEFTSWCRYLIIFFFSFMYLFLFLVACSSIYPFIFFTSLPFSCIRFILYFF